jgi:superkiller protein 3
MASVKNKLKLAREAIDKKDFEAARKACDGVLEYDPDNYNAYELSPLAAHIY